MQVGSRARVKKTKGTGHPAGTIVIVKILRYEAAYCKAEEGLTCYWYGLDELEEIKDERTQQSL